MKCIIGSDECLKGDTFGGIVVAAVLANDSQRATLSQIGVMDSKKVPDARIPGLAAAIKKICPHAIRDLFPVEYNQRSGKLTDLLNELHTSVADELRSQKMDTVCVHIVDQYPGCSAGDMRLIKAESQYVEVAAASILARDAGLLQLATLSQSAGFTLPKGSTHVASALARFKASKKDPAFFVKLHFRNVRDALR